MTTEPKKMASHWKAEPQAVADKVLKRVELSKMARNLQNRLALAQFKTKHGWEDLTLDKIEPKVEEEMRRKRALEGDGLSDSSSSTSDFAPYPSRALMSSPLKAPAPLFSDAVTGPSSSSGSTGHRKRTYHAFDTFNAAAILSSPTKRFRLSPTVHKSASTSSFSIPRSGSGRSGPLKTRRSEHFPPTSAAPSSFFSHSQPNFNAHLSDSEEDEALLPAHSFRPSQIARSSPPRTPPPPSHMGEPSSRATRSEEGADLLLYLAASPSPAPKRQGGLKSTSTLMEPPSTPPSRVVRDRGDVEKTPALPSSMLTPGGLFPTTPGPAFDLSDFVNITPSPAQKPWKTPLTAGRTPRVANARGKRLTFEE